MRTAMKTLTCPVCGATFVKRHNQVCCSPKCSEKRNRRKVRESYVKKGRKRTSLVDDDAYDAFAVSAPVSFNVLSKARTKPANTSAVRWRMELRRRATAKQHGRKCIWDCRPHPDQLY